MPVLLSAYSAIAQQQISDCISAMRVCDKEPIVFDNLLDAGKNSEEVGVTSCYVNSFPETNSAWITWKVRKAGTLEFSAIPINENDDLDFVLYRSNSPLSICDNKEEIRCMVSGENVGEEEDESYNCLGATGIKIGSGDVNEWLGCGTEDDNFLEGLEVKEGETYILMVNNISSDNGFVLEFFGSAEFEESGCQDVSSTYNGLSKEITVSDVYPNPSSSEVMIDITMPKNAEGLVYVFTGTGGLKYEIKQQFVQGTQTIPVDINNYPQGVYFLKIKIGEEFYITNFSKQ